MASLVSECVDARSIESEWQICKVSMRCRAAKTCVPLLGTDCDGQIRPSPSLPSYSGEAKYYAGCPRV